MSEFPWEVKKNSGKESSEAEETGPDNLGSEKTGTKPSIPDILANAFSETPMEEVKPEFPSQSGMPDEQSQQSAPPGFGNIADLSEISSAGDLNQGSPQSPVDDLPPFMQPGNNTEQITANEGAPSSDSINIDDIINNPPVSGNIPNENPEAPKKKSKKSPPPLFKPVLPGDEDEETAEVKPAGEALNSAPGLFKKSAFSPETSPETSAPEGSNVPGDPFQDQAPFPEEALQDMFPPQENMGPEIKDEPENPFPETAEPSKDPFAQAPYPDNPFSSSMPNFNGQLPDYVEPSANPFSDSSASPDPATNSIPGTDNPFSDQSTPSDNTTPDTETDPSNPFSESLGPSQNPFPDPANQANDPFSNPGAQAASPFPDFIPPGSSPFPEQESSTEGKPNLSGLVSSIGESVKLDELARNFDGIGGKLKSVFSSLTKGQSLIERMDELTDSKEKSTDELSESLFDVDIPTKDPFSEPASPETDPFQSTVGPDVPKFEDSLADGPESAVVSPFNENAEGGSSGDIRKVTSVSEPLMELKEEHRIDPFENLDNGGGKAPTPGTGEDITRTIPVGKQEGEVASDSPADGLSDLSVKISGYPSNLSDDFNEKSGKAEAEKSKAVSESELARMGQMSTDIEGLRSELESMLSRFENVEGNVSNLSETVSGFGPLISSGKKNEELLAGTAGKVESLDGKVDALEGKVYNIESSLVSVQADNEDIRSSLTRIEENVAELVNSYTALLVQVHESAQESDARFSQIENALEVLEPFEARFSAIEKSQEEARSTSMEMARSVSSLVDELGTTSSGFNEFKQNSEARQDKLEENIGSVTEYLDSELKKLGARSYKGFGQNVHLSNIMKNSTNMKLCMEWLEFLMELAGRNNLPDILSYYEDLGWITEDVRVELLHYAEGIDFYMEKPDWKLTPDDHVKSIWFIESLAGMKVDKNRLSVIERDIEKVKKGNEIYGI
ncbi:MAG: flagella protein [Methanolobus sp. T82-4]|nr:MAG: flagella protein [Methanolobus sp. T82-4]